jgi:hypothetical protein
MTSEQRTVYDATIENRRYTITRFDAKHPMTARGGMGPYPSGYQVRVIHDESFTHIE